jgi:hypothetical protein
MIPIIPLGSTERESVCCVAYNIVERGIIIVHVGHHRLSELLTTLCRTDNQ